MTSPRNLIFPLLGLLLFACPAARGADEEIVSRIKRGSVASSNVASIGYSKKLHALEIEFSRGAIYRFLDVPRGVYRELLAADSKGHFFAMHIRGKYRYVHVRTSARERPSGVIAQKN